MNVEKAMSCDFPSVPTKVLQEEVTRLREQRKLLYHAIPIGTHLPGWASISNEITDIEKKKKEEAKEETAGEALNKEIQRLREVCERKDRRYGKLRDELVLLSRELNKILQEYI